MAYLIGIDIGGTFTDCVLAEDDGSLQVIKMSSTPDDFSRGFFSALTGAADLVSLETPELLSLTRAIAHGTTVATNAMVQRRGARVGLLTTAGHASVLPMMRAYGRVAGLPPSELLHYSEADKPEPIIPRSLTMEIDERIDSLGEVVLSLDEEGAVDGINRLVQEGVEAIVIGLLWGFKNPAHEQRLEELVAEHASNAFISRAGALAPRQGEYERFTTAAINAYVGPVTRDYLVRVSERAAAAGYSRDINLMQCSGGITTARKAALAPVHLLGSGPAGGVIASAVLGKALGMREILATDMGGTTLDAGLVVESEPVSTSTSIVDQYEFFVPTIDIRSIGAGGGSIASFDEHSGTMRVGPESAGSMPGPICYGRGGQQPTVTDADLVFGYLDAELFAKGSMTLDYGGAWQGLERLGRELGLSPVATASGVNRIVDYQMADLMRQMTIERGYDPRDFVVFAYGGAGPLHGAVYARELGARQIVVPLGDTASAWSAVGVAFADVLHVHEKGQVVTAPWDPDGLAATLTELEETARTELLDDGFAAETIVLRRFVDIRYGLQTHVVEIAVPEGPVDEEAVAALAERFELQYESLYGKGAGFAGASTEIVTFRVRGYGIMPSVRLQPTALTDDTIPLDVYKSARRVYWYEFEETRETAVFDGARLASCSSPSGP